MERVNLFVSKENIFELKFGKMLIVVWNSKETKEGVWFGWKNRKTSNLNVPPAIYNILLFVKLKHYNIYPYVLFIWYYNHLSSWWLCFHIFFPMYILRIHVDCFVCSSSILICAYGALLIIRSKFAIVTWKPSLNTCTLKTGTQITS